MPRKMKLSTYVRNTGRSGRRASRSIPSGVCSSSTMIVIRIAITPSVKASRRPLLMAPNMAKSSAMTSPVRGLYVCIDVDDVERGIEFYARGLGLELGRRFDENWVELKGGPVPIDLLGRAKGAAINQNPGAPSRDYRRHWTPVHLDFVVEDL